MQKKIIVLSIFIILALTFSACGPAVQAGPSNSDRGTGNDGRESSSSEAGDVLPAADIPAPEPPPATVPAEPPSQPTVIGPDLANFPAGINPLTGLPVSDPSMLKLPAVLISITNFPASARPQAGLSYTPLIYEIYIGEGMTRFLAVFYGENPAVDPPLTGACPVREGPFEAHGPVLGDRVWQDKNGNGIQDIGEAGIGGVCVTLFDGSGASLESTSTDSNGYFGFNVEVGGTYALGFEKPSGLEFTSLNAGGSDVDSDADPATGKTAPLAVAETDLSRDAGLVSTRGGADADLDSGNSTPIPSNAGELLTDYPPAEVGPIRSMRLPYRYIAGFFPNSCLVGASGDPSVLAQVRSCHFQFGNDTDNINSALLDITKMHELAAANEDPNHPVNYSGNLFDQTPLGGGKPASQVLTLWSYLNQIQWRYDPLSGAYMRYDNRPNTPEQFFSETDRLTGRQLLFDNVIYIFADHIAYAETKIDIDLAPGNRGRAFLFRDGQMFPIVWSTINGAYEKQTLLLRPIKFVDLNGNPVALKPGHTWVHVFTQGSSIYEKIAGSGLWTADFNAPAVKK
jgi:hypothetical protein